MTTETDRDRTLRWLLASVVIVLILAAGCSGEADAAEYFGAFDQAHIELEAAVNELFSSPIAQQVEGFLEEGASGGLEADEDALVHQFVTEFWTGALDAIARHRQEFADIGVPGSVRSEHDAYIDALDAMLDVRDEYLAEVATTSGADLLATFWDPRPEVEAVNDTCSAIVKEAANEGFIIATPICEE